jgi:hypothetical protein
MTPYERRSTIAICVGTILTIFFTFVVAWNMGRESVPPCPKAPTCDEQRWECTAEVYDLEQDIQNYVTQSIHAVCLEYTTKVWSYVDEAVDETNRCSADLIQCQQDRQVDYITGVLKVKNGQ